MQKTGTKDPLHLSSCDQQRVYMELRPIKLTLCRQLLGHSSDVWVGLTGVFTIAVPALEVQSFASHEPISPTHNGSSSTLMAMNHTTLMQDLERLNDLLTIARNMLATTKRAQNLAADAGFDQQILKLVDVCVRVTARGYDGEAGTRSETQWAGVVGSCRFCHICYSSYKVLSLPILTLQLTF